MPTNATAEYMSAELEYTKSKSTQEKLVSLQKMLSLAPTHKGAEKLRAEIKTKISKFKDLVKKEAQVKKRGHSISVKKEGAAQVVLVGTANSGKSTLLAKLTHAKPVIAAYPFTTKLPAVGTLDYKNVKIQIVEIPAVTKDFYATEKGPIFLGIIRTADLIIILASTANEEKMIKSEIEEVGIDLPTIVYKNQKNLKDLIWKKLGLIKVYTKQPGKKPTKDPIALKKGSTIRNLAGTVHKDFIKKLRYARIWGKSAAFPGQQVGLDHVLDDDDIVQLHLK